MVGLVLIGFSAGLGSYSTDLVCLLAVCCVIVVGSGDWFVCVVGSRGLLVIPVGVGRVVGFPQGFGLCM